MERSPSEAALILELHLAKAEFDRAYSTRLAEFVHRESDTILDELITETQGLERRLADIADKLEAGYFDPPETSEAGEAEARQ